MKCKQLLGVLISLVVLCTFAAAAGPQAPSQLTNVSVASQGNATVITLHTTGAFTHNEYRPDDGLLLVDLAGVQAGKFQDRQRPLEVPGVKSYRVLTYKGASGSEVTRVEIALAPGADIQVSEVKGGMEVKVKGTAVAVQASPAPREVKPAVASRPKSEAVPAPANAVEITKVAVARGKAGMEIEIAGPATAQVMKLTGPDRIVLDVPNSVPALRTRNILVNTPDVKAVRVSRYQLDPPVTRIVVDLAVARDYELVGSGSGLLLRLRPAAIASAQPSSTPAVVDAPTPSPAKSEPVLVASAQPSTTPVPAEPKPAAQSDYVFVEPSFQAKPAETPTTEAKAEAPNVDPVVRAADAASTIAKAATTEKTNMLPPPSAAMQVKPAVNMALEQQQQAAQSASAAANRPRYTGEPISVNLKDVDLKDFFRLIHEISGLNVVLDPNVKGTLTLVLDDVPWDQALDIVLQNNGLDHQLQGNVLRIATVDTMRREAEAKRAQAEAQALAVDKQTVTRFLSYAHAKDIMPTVKRFLSQRGDVIADERTNALIIQDIPSVIPEVDRLLTQLDRKTQEVEIEARVVAATRNFARELGVQLGFGWGNGVSAVGGSSGAGQSPLLVAVPAPQYFVTGTDSAGGGGASTATPKVAIPLFSNLGVASPTSGLSFTNATNAYRLDAILTMAESRGLLKILSRPRVVTQNNVTAVVRQGFRIPIVTQAQLGGPPTVTYVDAFLRLTVTPQITAEGTIFLAVDVENTTPDFGRSLNGNPTLITQQATTQVLVTDGGTVVIGGVIQTQNSINTDQVPLLGDIPIFGNLFKRRSVKTSTQELIFFLSPKIIQT
ncbi:MAG TPA: type IV pilus secretin PilQ [Clostridia bacterium]|nr:type IV pilus secretin PilQ [Clostridia bacterium]